MKTIVVINCQKCKTENYDYFNFDEYASSCYRVSYNGLATSK